MVTVEARTSSRMSITSRAAIRACRPIAAIRRGAWWNAACECSICSAEVHIHIDKQLPVQGGLGAGSANAVAALTRLGAGTRAAASRPGTLCARAGDRLRRPAVSAGRSGCSGWAAGRRSIPCPTFLRCPACSRCRTPGFPPRRPTATGTACRLRSALTLQSPLSYNQGVESVDRCCIWRAALLRCLLHGEKTGPRIRFSRLSEPGSKTTSNRSSFLSIPFSVKSSAFLWVRLQDGGRGCLCRPFRVRISPFWALPYPGRGPGGTVRLERHGVTGLVTRTLPRSDYWRTMMVADAA